jgi:hypothetical protein
MALIDKELPTGLKGKNMTPEIHRCRDQRSAQNVVKRCSSCDCHLSFSGLRSVLVPLVAIHLPVGGIFHADLRFHFLNLLTLLAIASVGLVVDDAIIVEASNAMCAKAIPLMPLGARNSSGQSSPS